MFQLKNKLNKEECLKLLAQEDFKRITLSFYRYVKIKEPRVFRDELFAELAEIRVLGRIYVAGEGINAQISVPEPHFERFKSILNSHEELKDMYLNIAVENKESFYKLKIKIRKQIVTDGLPEDSYDLSQVGKHLTAEEFNAALDEGALVVDMRNFYESRIGRFEGALCPDSETFKEELPMAVEALKGQEDKKVLLYCTGGIRCEKASAYFKHKGFKDVNQLRGGIISYAHEVKQKGLESKFKGNNFVFDERLNERITEDILSDCDQCDTACDAYTNCQNAACNLLFIQCEACQERMNNTCSDFCKDIAALPDAEKKAYYAQQKSTDYSGYKSRIRPKLKASRQ